MTVKASAIFEAETLFDYAEDGAIIALTHDEWDIFAKEIYSACAPTSFDDEGGGCLS